MYFEPSRREKRDGVTTDSLSLLVQKLLVKNDFYQKPDLTSGPDDLDINLSKKLTKVGSIKILARNFTLLSSGGWGCLHPPLRFFVCPGQMAGDIDTKLSSFF